MAMFSRLMADRAAQNFLPHQAHVVRDDMDPTQPRDGAPLPPFPNQILPACLESSPALAELNRPYGMGAPLLLGTERRCFLAANGMYPPSPGWNGKARGAMANINYLHFK
jgi:hypothetical protein